MVTYGGEQSLDRFLALSARGLPFNIAHAAGNVALALAAGPAIARMLLRYREPLRVRLGALARARGSRGGSAAGLGCLLLAVRARGPARGRAGGGGGPRRGRCRSPGCATPRTATAASAPTRATSPTRR